MKQFGRRNKISRRKEVEHTWTGWQTGRVDRDGQVVQTRKPRAAKVARGERVFEWNTFKPR